MSPSELEVPEGTLSDPLPDELRDHLVVGLARKGVRFHIDRTVVCFKRYIFIYYSYQ